VYRLVTPGRPSGESVAGQREDDHVETGPANAVRGRVGQPRNHRQELGEATRPAVGQISGIPWSWLREDPAWLLRPVGLLPITLFGVFVLVSASPMLRIMEG
jgi:hypothetical protein